MAENVTQKQKKRKGRESRRKKERRRERKRPPRRAGIARKLRGSAATTTTTTTTTTRTTFLTNPVRAARESYMPARKIKTRPSCIFTSRRACIMQFSARLDAQFSDRPANTSLCSPRARRTFSRSLPNVKRRSDDPSRGHRIPSRYDRPRRNG